MQQGEQNRLSNEVVVTGVDTLITKKIDAGKNVHYSYTGRVFEGNTVQQQHRKRTSRQLYDKPP